MRSSLAICGVLLSLAATPALAQTARVTGPCGTATLTLGRDQPATMDTTGALCTDAVVGAATAEASSTITTGGTFQTIAAANAARRSLEFINLCNVATACTTTANVCYLFIAASGTPTKTTNAIPVPAGGSYLRSSGVIPTDAIQATCDGTGDHYRLAVQ